MLTVAVQEALLCGALYCIARPWSKSYEAVRTHSRREFMLAISLRDQSNSEQVLPRIY